MDRAAALIALQRVIAFTDYDLSKHIDEPEDEFGDTWNDLMEVFMDTYEAEINLRK